MPARKQNNGNGFGVEFVTINLSADDGKKFNGWKETLGDVWADEFATYVSNGFKVGLTWDNNNACFIASLTGKEEGSKNYNCCLTARSQEWVEALQLVHFKASVFCADGRWQDHSTSVSWG